MAHLGAAHIDCCSGVAAGTGADHRSVAVVVPADHMASDHTVVTAAVVDTGRRVAVVVAAVAVADTG